MKRYANEFPDLRFGPMDDAPSPMASVPLGPQPGSPACCESCRIVAEAVAILAYDIGYPMTGDQIRALLRIAHGPATEAVNQ